MKNLKTISILLIFFCLIACNGTEKKSKTNSYQLINNSTFKLLTELSTLNQFKIRKGDKLVFLYQNQGVTFAGQGNLRM